MRNTKKEEMLSPLFLYISIFFIYIFSKKKSSINVIIIFFGCFTYMHILPYQLFSSRKYTYFFISFNNTREEKKKKTHSWAREEKWDMFITTIIGYSRERNKRRKSELVKKTAHYTEDDERRWTTTTNNDDDDDDEGNYLT